MEAISVTWWMWFVFGVLMLLAEFLTPGAFFQFFLGVAAIVLGLLELAGLELGFPAQMLLYLALSIGLIVLLRKPLRMRFAGSGPDEDNVDTMVGETARAVGEIAAGDIGKAEMRGTVWDARNVGETAIAASQRCRVERVEGLTLHLRG